MPVIHISPCNSLIDYQRPKPVPLHRGLESKKYMITLTEETNSQKGNETKQTIARFPEVNKQFSINSLNYPPNSLVIHTLVTTDNHQVAAPQKPVPPHVNHHQSFEQTTGWLNSTTPWIATSRHNNECNFGRINQEILTKRSLQKPTISIWARK